jgi:carbon starvation protein
MFVLVAIVMVEAIRSWIRYAKTVPQDYRTQAEIEAATKKELDAQKETVCAE